MWATNTSTNSFCKSRDANNPADRWKTTRSSIPDYSSATHVQVSLEVHQDGDSGSLQNLRIASSKPGHSGNTVVEHTGQSYATFLRDENCNCSEKGVHCWSKILCMRMDSPGDEDAEPFDDNLFVTNIQLNARDTSVAEGNTRDTMHAVTKTEAQARSCIRLHGKGEAHSSSPTLTFAHFGASTDDDGNNCPKCWKANCAVGCQTQMATRQTTRGICPLLLEVQPNKRNQKKETKTKKANPCACMSAA